LEITISGFFYTSSYSLAVLFKKPPSNWSSLLFSRTSFIFSNLVRSDFLVTVFARLTLIGSYPDISSGASWYFYFFFVDIFSFNFYNLLFLSVLSISGSSSSSTSTFLNYMTGIYTSPRLSARSLPLIFLTSKMELSDA
jgi:hypothetical protein